MRNFDGSDSTPLQRFQRELSALLERTTDELNDVECEAALTYTVMRATIVLAPSRAEQLRRGE